MFRILQENNAYLRFIKIHLRLTTNKKTMNNKSIKTLLEQGILKKILFFSFVLMASYTSIYAQDPIVIKQDSTVRDLDNGEEQDVRELPFRQRLRFGGGIGGLQFGNPTVVGVSPMVGYQATNDFTVGLALDYQYQGGTDRFSGVKYSINQYGPRLFGQYRLHFLEQILSRAFAQVEVQKYYGSQSFNGGSLDINYDAQALAGIGVGFGGFQLTALYNLNYNQLTSPYGSPIVIRVGGFFF